MLPFPQRYAKRRLAIAGAALGLCVFLTAAFVFLPKETCLVAECDGKPLFAWPIRAGDHFEVTFTHSLNHSPITDVVEWTGNGFIVRKSIFRSFGAGVPVPADGIGTELVHIDGHYELLGVDKHMNAIPIMTQTAPDHRIAYQGREASLLELAGSGKTVEVAVWQLSRFERFLFR